MSGRQSKKVPIFLLALLAVALLAGCAGADDPDCPRETVADRSTVAPFEPAADGSNYREPAVRNLSEEERKAAASQGSPENFWESLDVPTCIARIDGTWFLADCYHNQILWNDAEDAPERPLTDWRVVTADATQPHTIAGVDGVYLVDDTENNRVLVFERVEDAFVNTQTFWNIGVRPHYTAYDPRSDTWYVWSSMTGELYLFRRAKGTKDVYLTEIRQIEALRGIYIRSFTIVGDRIYFVSGIPSPENPSYRSAILCCDLKTLDILASYPVPESIAGMSQLFPTGGNCFLISVSTDAAGDQGAAALIRAGRLSDLEKGEYEDVYAACFVGGGTPYYMARIDNDCYLTEHRLRDHALWRFRIEKDGTIDAVKGLY